MNKAETYEFLNKSGINYEITEHKAVFNMEELGEVKLPYPEFDAKNTGLETYRSPLPRSL